jgi:drug/metabolite transporter (DMT)-like permease
MKYILAILSIISAVVAQVLVKNASLTDLYGRKWILLILASITVYGIAFILQSYVFRFFPLSKIGPPSAIAVMVLVFGCGVWLFGDTVQTKQILGVILGVISIYLIMA